MKYQIGIYCRVVGDTPRNRVLELFLESRSQEFAPADVSEQTDISLAYAHRLVNHLVEEGYLVAKRKEGNRTLYGLNGQKKEVHMLIRFFDEILKKALLKV